MEVEKFYHKDILEIVICSYSILGKREIVAL
jgi:hypothetical protein